MPTHTVEQGECLSSIAEHYGFFWETLWDHSENRELRQQRGSPNVLCPGDVVFVPEKGVREESGETETRHRFRAKGVPAYLNLRLLDEEGNPRSSLVYELTIDGDGRSGTTDDEGRIQEPIPPRAGKAVLKLTSEGGKTEEYELLLGEVDAITDVTGVQTRLRNMGYDPGTVDGEEGDRTRAAIRAFQRSIGEEETGELTDSQRKALEEAHGS